ncbi:MAG: alanine--tRNA ligase [Omnitrophica WOR_2 bacterium RIFCSPHIGHO2_02_FULL_63_39]|nr:MAG: alanine--tRNA ligase [Omnitrophica WOR_2 bacterium RIFCSPHIGHO2_02_FULL_63_39]OGX49023.1 MAG: alanine--tRNA ligase [Omnitrophica WOR_2 bacterium RIFCSPLOWO2_12_FULL_63_16]
MTSNELRDRFRAFFKAKEHPIIPSDSLIPSGDPTVLFTSAGMNQFKDYFLGKRTDLKRAASCQKCLRTGDLERVGKTPNHHSFFEMLGNFSFGDYFKAEAIAWAWEFLTGLLPAKKLWISIYEEDDEAFGLWRKLGVPEPRIKRFGQADNFWPANAPAEGPNGPCGPCSELYYDPDGKVQGPNSVEVWNLVFTQFDRQPDGTLKPLPKPNIDTGMGLERLTAVVQGVETDYETDLFGPIVQVIHSYFAGGLRKDEDRFGPEGLRAVWTIADHLRAIVFLLAESLVPSNEGRGYVLRMLIRRAHWHGGRLLWNRKSVAGGKPEYQEPFLAEMAPTLIKTYRIPYPQLEKSQHFILKAIRAEEERFVETLDAGNEQIQQELDRLRAGKITQISGDFAFKMKDTYGYPFELLSDIAQRHGFAVDQGVFKQRLGEQRERSRAGSQFGGDIFVAPTLKLPEPVPVEFVGYQALQAEAHVKGIWKQDQWVSAAGLGDHVGLVLDRSPFYGESGGQIGDRGTINAPKGTVEVVDTKWVDDLLVHDAKISHGTVKINDPVRTQVNPDHRLKVARSHTGAHLLHWALRKVLGPETVQAGSLVEMERVRFDFSSLGGLQEEQRAKVEQLVNDRIRCADSVQTATMNVDEAKHLGALALFGEKYGQQVRVVSIGDYSKELCGGTHLMHTGLMGMFRIVAESSIAAGTRRIEALVGEAADERQRQERHLLAEAARRLSRPAPEVVEGLDELLGQLKRSEQQRRALQVELAKGEAARLVANAKQIRDVTFISAALKDVDREVLAIMADAIRPALKGSGVVVLASADGAAKVSLVVAVTSSLAKRVHAGELLKAVAPLVQGSGGGRPEFAQGGGKDPSKISEALKRSEEMVRRALGS